MTEEERQQAIEYIEARYTPEPNSGCWLWYGKLRRKGYGGACIFGKTIPSHRLSYELYREPIPAGLVIDHLCRNPACINPDHLEPVTMRENTIRGIGPSAKNAAKARCGKGHEFKVIYNGDRRCIACRSEYDKARAERRNEARRRKVLQRRELDKRERGS